MCTEGGRSRYREAWQGLPSGRNTDRVRRQEMAGGVPIEEGPAVSLPADSTSWVRRYGTAGGGAGGQMEGGEARYPPKIFTNRGNGRRQEEKGEGVTDVERWSRGPPG